MKATVKDANILIDLADADLLGVWFGLKIETHTTDLVLNEIKETSQRRKVMSFVDAGLLKVTELKPGELAVAVTLSHKMRVSLPDASAYWLAHTLGAILLSGDSVVRKGAMREGIEVRGVLWVLDLLVEKAALPPTEAAARLQEMLKNNSFLPYAECSARIRRWMGTEST
jgi:predicted nucleic acid-binding protein